MPAWRIMRVCAALTYVMARERRGGMRGVVWWGHWRRRGEEKSDELMLLHCSSYIHILWSICHVHTLAHAQPPIHSVVVRRNVCRFTYKFMQTQMKRAAHYCVIRSKFSIVLQNLEADMDVTIFLLVISLSTSLWMGISVCMLSSTCITVSTGLMLSCEQTEPLKLRLVIAANPFTLSCDKAVPHYPECV